MSGTPSSTDSASIPHVRALDGLRGAAVVAVLLFHAGHLAGGYLGVDLFFVLSGFLITSLLLAEWRKEERVRLGAFWARRARRLLPALFLVVIGIGAYAAFVAAPTELDRIRDDALATLAYVANWNSIGAGHDYWALFSSPSPFEHTWSLAIEEQFYLVWPLVFVGIGVLARRRHRPVAPRVFAVAIVGSLVFGALAIGLTLGAASDARVYFGTDTRAPAILLGVALAAAVAWRGVVRSNAGRVALEVIGFLGVAWLVWAWADLGGQDPELLRGGLLVSGVAAVAVLAAAAHPLRGPIGTGLSFRPLCWLGLISYGLYLWHWPVYVWLNPTRTGLDGWALTGARLAVSLAFAVLSYFLVEMPIRRGALRGRPIQVLAPVTVAITVVIVLVATVGSVQRPTTEDTIAAGKKLTTQGPPPPPEVPRILVVGDSVAHSIGASLDAVEASEGVASYNAGVVGCEIPRSDRHGAPTFDSEPPTIVLRTLPACNDWPSRWTRQLTEVQPDHVLLVLGHPAVEDIELDGEWHAACDPWWRDFFRSEIGQALDVLASTGAKVTVVSIAPPNEPDVFPPELTDAVGCLNGLLRDAVAASPARDRIIDLAALICPRGVCRRELEGKSIREDFVHYYGEGGQVVARWIIDRMTETPRVA